MGPKRRSDAAPQADPPRGDALREKNPEIPADIDAAVRKALNKSPADRFPSMEDAALALEGQEPSPSGDEEMVLAETQEGAAHGPARCASWDASPSRPLAHGTGPPGRWFPWLVIAAVASMGLLAGAVVLRRSAPAPRVEQPTGPDAATGESRMSSNGEAMACLPRGHPGHARRFVAHRGGSSTTRSSLIPASPWRHLARAFVRFLYYDDVDSKVRQDLLDARNAREALGERDRLLLLQGSRRSSPIRPTRPRSSASIERRSLDSPPTQSCRSGSAGPAPHLGIGSGRATARPRRTPRWLWPG